MRKGGWARRRLISGARSGKKRQHLFFLGSGWFCRIRVNTEKQEKCFRQALALNPDFAPAYNHLGLALQSGQRFDEAMQCFREAVRCHPGYARAHNNLGHLLKAHGKLQEAAACFREAVRLEAGLFSGFL